MMIRKPTGLSILLLALIATCSMPVLAKGKAKGDWNASHPRRHEVNKRLNNQNQRIRHERKEGEITKGQAARLHREDRHIRREERRDASQHGGHITRTEQQQLNREENAVSHQIGR
jgi:hypothetical protein